MRNISDLIEQHLKKLLSDSINDFIEIQRSELAGHFKCVPSQINYVLTTRFTPEHGYVVETRRGGGGYIRITRVRFPRETLIMHTVNAAGDALDARSAAALLQNLAHVLPDEIVRVLGAACSERALRALPSPLRDEVRADIFKQCVIQLTLDLLNT